MPKRLWEASKSTVEKAPNRLQVSHEQPGVMPVPHWHAQLEINFILRGAMDYQMHGYSLHLERGALALFWGGRAHQVVDTSPDPEYIAFHLPLMNFFRLRLPETLQRRVIHGATLLAATPDKADFYNFARWAEYMRSGDALRVEHAVEELLLRIERVAFEPYALVDTGGAVAETFDHSETPAFARIRRICDFIADNFREDIDISDIAGSANLHPKYAMNVFRRATGMTLNEYVNLLRLSYAQAMLISEGGSNVLRVAMESGFGSLSAFNKSFKRIAGISPSHFRREYRPRGVSLPDALGAPR